MVHRSLRRYSFWVRSTHRPRRLRTVLLRRPRLGKFLLQNPHPRSSPKRQRRFTPRKKQSFLHHALETRKRFKNRRAGFRLERQVAKRRRSGRLVRKFTPTGSVSSKLAVSILRRSRSKRLTFVERREDWRERKRKRERERDTEKCTKFDNDYIITRSY